MDQEGTGLLSKSIIVIRCKARKEFFRYGAFEQVCQEKKHRFYKLNQQIFEIIFK